MGKLHDDYADKFMDDMINNNFKKNRIMTTTTDTNEKPDGKTTKFWLYCLAHNVSDIETLKLSPEQLALLEEAKKFNSLSKDIRKTYFKLKPSQRLLFTFKKLDKPTEINLSSDQFYFDQKAQKSIINGWDNGKKKRQTKAEKVELAAQAEKNKRESVEYLKQYSLIEAELNGVEKIFNTYCLDYSDTDITKFKTKLSIFKDRIDEIIYLNKTEKKRIERQQALDKLKELKEQVEETEKLLKSLEITVDETKVEETKVEETKE